MSYDEFSNTKTSRDKAPGSEGSGQLSVGRFSGYVIIWVQVRLRIGGNFQGYNDEMSWNDMSYTQTLALTPNATLELYSQPKSCNPYSSPTHQLAVVP